MLSIWVRLGLSDFFFLLPLRQSIFRGIYPAFTVANALFCWQLNDHRNEKFNALESMAHSLSPVITCLFLYPRMRGRLTNKHPLSPSSSFFLPQSSRTSSSHGHILQLILLFVRGSFLMITFLSLLHSFLLSFPMPEIEVEQKGKWVVWSFPPPPSAPCSVVLSTAPLTSVPPSPDCLSCQMLNP